MTEDFYDLLDVPSEASQEEIKAAYREKVRVYHPDLNDDDRARAQFTAVKKAYEILGDPIERQAYDRLGHEEYVSKRTNGIPSPDVWRTDDDESSSDETPESDESQADGDETAGSDDSTDTAATGAGATAGRSNEAASADGGSTTSATSQATGSAAGATTGPAAGSSTAGSGDVGTTDASSRRDNVITRWWRRQNFSLPLIWISMFVYLAGVVDFVVRNESALSDVAIELGAAAGATEIWEALTVERHGVDTTVAYLSSVEPVAQPVEPLIWYVGLTGIVGLTLFVLLGVRVATGRSAREPLSIDETIVLAAALATTTGVVGGPLLAGAVLMPVLVTVIVRHTRRGRGWQPSYLWTVPVLGPLAGIGFAAITGDQPTLVIDLLAFVILPVIGALGLPLRATIRKRFGT